MNPFTSFDDVPIVCSVEDAARVLNVSASYLYRRLTAGQFVPGLMPRDGQAPYQFSKKKLQDYVEGGYALQVRRRA